MKNSQRRVLQPAVAIRAAGGVRATEVQRRKPGPSAEVLEMFAKIDRSDDFTVANALDDYAGVNVKY